MNGPENQKSIAKDLRYIFEQKQYAQTGSFRSSSEPSISTVTLLRLQINV